jgi:hypothetical protein
MKKFRKIPAEFNCCSSVKIPKKICSFYDLDIGYCITTMDKKSNNQLIDICIKEQIIFEEIK